MAVQLEKTDREIEKKISLISQERETLEDKRWASNNGHLCVLLLFCLYRVKESLNVEELSKDLGNIQVCVVCELGAPALVGWLIDCLVGAVGEGRMGGKSEECFRHQTRHGGTYHTPPSQN